MNRGFSLLELILALFLFQVGLLGAAGLIHLSEVNLRRAELTVRATLEAEWTGDSLLARGSITPGVAALPWGELRWSVFSSPVPGFRIAAWSEVEGDTLVTLLSLPPLARGVPVFPPTPEMD